MGETAHGDREAADLVCVVVEIMFSVCPTRDGEFVVLEHGHTMVAGPFADQQVAREVMVAFTTLRSWGAPRVRISWSEPQDPGSFDAVNG